MSPLLPIVQNSTLPLFSRRQIRDMGRRGPHSPGFCKHRNNSQTLQHQVYCSHNEKLNDILKKLHNDLRNGIPETQQKIDSYLFAVRKDIPRKLPLESHILSPFTTPRFENLPDISRNVINVLLSTDSDNSIQAQFLRQCIPLKRRTKRAQREIIWKPESCLDMKVYIRCLYGSLLGLYPTCSKFSHFNNRVAINALLHSVLVSPPENVTRFCNTLSYILRIGVMEHVCQTIEHFCPGVVYALNKKKQFYSFCNTMRSVGDTFRAEMNKFTLSADDLHETMATFVQLNTNAQILFDRCSRAFRTVVPATHSAPIPSQVRKMILQSAQNDPHFFPSAMQAFVSPNKYLFCKLNATLFPPDVSDLVWRVLNNTRVACLPVQITLKQMACIRRIHPSDFTLQQQQAILQVCILCALKNSYHASICSTRYDAVTRELTCVDCNQNSIVHVNLTGRVLYIGPRAIVLSQCCSVPIIWGGGGAEWSEKCGPHCIDRCFQKQIAKRKKMSTVVTKPSALCYVCQSKTVGQCRRVLNMRRKRLQDVYFCNKHQPPTRILNSITNVHELREFFDPTLSFMSSQG
jgi:hypothetical protein